MKVFEEKNNAALRSIPTELEHINHALTELVQQSKLIEKSINVLIAVEYARLHNENKNVCDVDPKEVLAGFDALALASNKP